MAREKNLHVLSKALFADRNVKMAGKIDGYLKGSGTYFIVIAAGHLGGKEGILALLKEKGYAMERR